MSKLTLEDAISHCLEVAEARETEVLKYNYCRGMPDVEKVVSDCKECAADHRQLAEWLIELRKAKRLLGEALRTLNDSSCNKDCRQCKWNETGCEMSCRFAWKYGDEASALIGDENDAE